MKMDNFEEALDNYDKALKINPNYYSAYVAKGGYIGLSTDFIKSIENYHKALNLIRGDERPSLLRNLGLIISLVLDSLKKQKIIIRKHLHLDGDSAEYFYDLATIEFCNENFENAILFIEKAMKIDSTYHSRFGMD